MTTRTANENSSTNLSKILRTSTLSFLGWALLAGAGSLQASVQTATRPIPDSFIVVLKADAGTQSIGAARTTAQLAFDLSGFYGVQTVRTFDTALKGFAFHGSSAAADNLSRDARVAYVAQDGLVTLSSVQMPSPSWGLDRIDQRGPALDTEYAYYADGAGVDLYVVDTGIRSTHEDFGGRVDTVNAFTAVNDGHGTEDCNGHGTHVAGVAGGTTYGVAKGVTLHPVRVVGCDGTGSVSNTIAGIDWITSQQSAAGARRAVVNISLDNGFSFPLEAAVSQSIAAGVVYVVAAGNYGDEESACYLSPQRLPEVITVGASDENGARWASSDFGPCVDLFAPGTDIRSALATDDESSFEMTGTSVASPHVAGTAALVLASHPELTPAEVQGRILAAATVGALTDVGEGNANLLLYSAIEGLGDPDPMVFRDGFESGDINPGCRSPPSPDGRALGTDRVSGPLPGRNAVGLAGRWTRG